MCGGFGFQGYFDCCWVALSFFLVLPDCSRAGAGSWLVGFGGQRGFVGRLWLSLGFSGCGDFGFRLVGVRFGLFAVVWFPDGDFLVWCVLVWGGGSACCVFYGCGMLLDFVSFDCRCIG